MSDALLNLQKRLDDFALTLDGDERLLVWSARAKLQELGETIQRIRTAAGG